MRNRRLEKLLLLVLALPAYLASLVWPKRNDLWMFGAWFGHQYSDNSRYLFEEVADNWNSRVEAWWVTKDKEIQKAITRAGRNAVYAYSLKGFLLQLRARVFVCSVNSLDFVPVFITQRNYFVQLWHGTPFKAILLQTIHSRSRRYWMSKLRTTLIDNYRMIISPGPYSDSVYTEAFGLPEDRLFRAGYPRCDALHLSQEHKERIRAHFAPRGSGLWFYLPTHRAEGKLESTPNLEQAKELVRLSDEFRKRNVVLVIKPHFYERRFFEGLTGTENVQVHLDLPEELYACLGASDGLLTDYSSVVFDYAVLQRPIVFFAYDEQKYVTSDRDLKIRVDDLSQNVTHNVRDIPEILASTSEGTGLRLAVADVNVGGQSFMIAREVLRRLGTEIG